MNDSLIVKVRPIVGGIKIVGFDPEGCTLGFILKFDNVFYASTAAHCSDPAGVVTPIVMQQGGNIVATETFDPPPTTWAGPFWQPARWNESALYRIHVEDPSVTYAFGKVAHAADSLGSLAINQASPQLTLTAEENGGITDDWFVYHVGFVSGWRYGWVVDSCVDDGLVAAQTGYWLRCSFRADFYTNHGDSGGPVIAPYQGGWMAVGTIYGKFSSQFPWWIDNQGMFSGFRGLDLDLTGVYNSGRLKAK
jgi:hypothetical protein